MAYIGNPPITGNFQVCDAISVVNGQAAYTMQVSSANVIPESANHMLVSLNGVLQKPNSSFTISGSTITFASNLATGDVIDFIILLGNVLDLGVPSDATVTNAKTNFTSTSSAAGLQIKGDGTTDGTLQLNCSQNSHGIKLSSPAHSSGQSYTLKFPTENVAADKILKVASVSGSGTTGIGQLSFVDEPSGSHTLISTTTNGSAASSLDITSGIDSTYKLYMIDVFNANPVVDYPNFQLRLSQGGSFITSSTYDDVYSFMNQTSGSTSESATENGDKIRIGQAVGNQTNEGVHHCRVFLFDPSNTSLDATFRCETVFQSDGDRVYLHTVVGRLESTTAVDGVRFFMSSGNIRAGATVKLYGVS